MKMNLRIAKALIIAVTFGFAPYALSAGKCEWNLMEGIFKLPEYWGAISKLDQRAAELYDKGVRPGGLSPEEKRELEKVKKVTRSLEKQRQNIAFMACENQ